MQATDWKMRPWLCLESDDISFLVLDVVEAVFGPRYSKHAFERFSFQMQVRTRSITHPFPLVGAITNCYHFYCYGANVYDKELVFAWRCVTGSSVLRHIERVFVVQLVWDFGPWAIRMHSDMYTSWNFNQLVARKIVQLRLVADALSKLNDRVCDDGIDPRYVIRRLHKVSATWRSVVH